MTDTEMRRMKLLQQTRALYSDRRGIPAVHPRYQSAYDRLYGSQEGAGNRYRNGTFGIRVFISILLFALFVVADYKGTAYASVDSAKIIHEIKRDIEID